MNTIIYRRKLGKVSLNSVTIVLILLTLFPLLWLFLTAIKQPIDAFAMPPKWIFEPTSDNFLAVLTKSEFVKSYVNSLIVVTGTTVLSLWFGIASGYTLARSKSRFSNAMGMWIILARMAPPMGFVLPLYLMFSKIGILDTYFGLILVYLTVTLPFVTWLMVGFIKSIPIEIEEASAIDGCNRFQTLIRIVIPSSLPGISTCAIFAFIMSWNEFFYALIISGRNTRTASVEIQGFINFAGINWGELAAAGVLVVVPVLIFTIFAQKGLVRGLTQGATK
ncbi:carbohydrate ABC transporter permease [Cohnella faecalis]|uniref:Carbohydrate ABC transporter permease n=1 Tax=Cohnella faecalis TaxID=2315694 RepID=A0A398CTE6_9BACL|nr:carbohydrate ABC transporter permease [Cohnella faecalis]RIE03107.1 carbohydrate ABC transporter permease [Cohnella faecalis]